MSYVLEALKRANAERERECQAVPGLQAQTVTLLAPPRGGSRLWPWLGGAAALVVGATMWWQLRAGPAPAAADLPLQANLPAVPQPAPSIPVERPPTKPSPQSGLPATSMVAPAARTVGAVAPAPPAAPSRVLRMSELPADLRSALPPLVVNGSVYAGQAAERLLILNGQPLHEGDTVAPDLVLEQIQLQSVVLNLRGTRFSLPF